MLRQQCGLCGGFLATPKPDETMLRCQRCGATFEVPSGEKRLSDEVLHQWARQRLETPEPAEMARECHALRAEVDRLKLKVVELSRGAWAQDAEARLAALTDPATVERVARAAVMDMATFIRDQHHARSHGGSEYLGAIHGTNARHAYKWTPVSFAECQRPECGAARAALAALGDVKPPATRNLP